VTAPRVSIVIPAYNERFFAEALASACAQTYADAEIVVCDDSPGGAIEAATKAANDARVRYVRNPRNLGFSGNFTECFRQARGELVKFLNDDDILEPRCVEGLVGGFDFDPRVTLVTSRRRPIDANGQVVQGHLASAPISHVSCLVPGHEMGNIVLINSVNFIGEPSTAMFRKRDVIPEPGGIFHWGGRDYHCLADLSLWMRLLARGHAFYQALTLSGYRIHPGQQQALDEMDSSCIAERYHLAREARKHGFLAKLDQYRAAITMPLKMARNVLQAKSLAPAARDELEALAARITAELHVTSS
jgi:glycosyltransferase involved in cell wall biosynthesis